MIEPGVVMMSLLAVPNPVKAIVVEVAITTESVVSVA